MSATGYSLGLDLSTQSITAIMLDLESGARAASLSLNYADDPRLNAFGIDRESYLVPPRERGEADQPPKMFIAALDAIFSDLSKTADLSKVRVVNCSAQQHGHVYLNGSWTAALSKLGDAGSGQQPLVRHLADIWSYGAAPIWKTSNTQAEADAIRSGAGGRAAMIRLSGSDSPLRFSGAAMRRTALRAASAWKDTSAVRLLSAFVAAVLSGVPDAPTDWGNACGMSLMDYSKKTWSPELTSACMGGIEGGGASLLSRLGRLDSPLARVGTVARYFTERYGLPRDAAVLAGSGDNPQTKVLANGDLLSLGTSFVAMVATAGGIDQGGSFNAMYDGLGRSFMFGCRTNGALVWDRVRATHGLEKRDYASSDRALGAMPVGSRLAIWQPDAESFPLSSACECWRDYPKADFDSDWAAIVDSSLSIIYLGSKAFSADSAEPLALTGGPSSSRVVMERVAAIWDRPVQALAAAGAAAGAACAGIYALSGDGKGFKAALETCCEPGKVVKPDHEAAARLRAPGGYFDKLATAFKKQTS